jgi:hypothetical protein
VGFREHFDSASLTIPTLVARTARSIRAEALGAVAVVQKENEMPRKRAFPTLRTPHPIVIAWTPETRLICAFVRHHEMAGRGGNRVQALRSRTTYGCPSMGSILFQDLPIPDGFVSFNINSHQRILWDRCFAQAPASFVRAPSTSG